MNDLAKFWKASGKALEDLKIFGSGWERASAHLAPHVFEGGRRVSTEECASIFRSAEVSLNIHSGPGDGFDVEGLFVNPRTFEVAASGGCQIVDFRPLLEDLFPSGELTAIRDPAELPDALDRALADPDLRRAQAEDARKTVMSRHLYRHRLEAILKAMGAPGSPPEPLER